MKKLQTITIGIPVYNEEENIALLVRNITDQKIKNGKLEKIIICSDGSTDNTVSILQNMNNKLLKIIIREKRIGKYSALNKIIDETKSDILIFLDADVLIKDSLFVEKLINPHRVNNADLTSAKVQEIQPVNFFERILSQSMHMKRALYESIKNGNNIYTCFGRAMAFSKNLYSNIIFPKDLVADDAYAYLFCVKNNFKYEYVNNTNIFYKLPGSINDHQKQSVRFFSTQKQLYKIFGKQFVKNEYAISIPVIVTTLFSTFLNKPFFMIMYTVIVTYMKIISYFRTTETRWEVAKSSKLII